MPGANGNQRPRSPSVQARTQPQAAEPSTARSSLSPDSASEWKLPSCHVVGESDEVTCPERQAEPHSPVLRARRVSFQARVGHQCSQCGRDHNDKCGISHCDKCHKQTAAKTEDVEKAPTAKVAPWNAWHLS